MKPEKSSHSYDLDGDEDGTEEPCICGDPHNEPSSYIIGGNETTPNEFPWMVAVTGDLGHIGYCGGVLINDYYVLTAAHCVGLYVHHPSRISIVIGAHKIREPDEPPAFRVRAEKIVEHPDFGLENDIALIRLEEQVTFSDVAQPICLPIEGEEYEGKTATVAGWGTTEEGKDSPPDTLLKMEVPIQPVEKCITDVNRNLSLMLCTFWDEGGIGLCHGDSGGPLMLKTENGWELIGLVSWAERCAAPGAPTGCTRVNKYLKWLSTKMRGAKECNRKKIMT